MLAGLSLAMVEWAGRVKAWLSLLDVVVLGSANSAVHLVPLLLLLLPSQLRPPLLRISFTLLLLLLLPLHCSCHCC